MDGPDAQTFGDLVRRYRRRAGLTQEELAEGAEMSPRGLIYLERGERHPQPGTARRLADALGLTGEERSSFLAAVDGVAVPGTTPSGAEVRTFLIADMRGYTRFTNERGDEAAARLADRFAVVAGEIVRQRGGEVIELRGDEALAVFESAREALRAALDLQDRWEREREADPALPLQIGIGIDAGEAIPVQGGYRGGALNLAARLCSVAAPGEVLVSDGVIHLARKMEGLVYLDRGEVQLKGLPRPVPVVQVVPEGAVPAQVEKFTAGAAPRANLPDQPTPFIGREREVAAVAGLLRRDDVRLLTLTGPGGTGKTRLALKVAEDVMDAFPDGAFFVSLAPLTDPQLVASAVATELGLTEEGETPIVETLSAALQGRSLLLVLDNFEHLPDAAPLLPRLLSAGRGLKILVTSLTALHLAAEHEYPVPPLDAPNPKDLPDLESLLQFDAVNLFLRRAEAVKPGFALTEDVAREVAEICFRVDGLPLAIELAAARLKLFPPHALLQRLSSRLKLLTGGARDLPARHQTLRGTLDWSYGLLEDGEKTLFARLAVFAGGFTLDAAEAVCGAAGPCEADVLDGLSSLVDKSLVREVSGGAIQGELEPRFAMLETIREYALERLEESGDGEPVRRAHAEHYASLVEEAEKAWFGPDHGQWLQRLDTEHDNLRAALSWAVEAGQADLAMRLAGRAWRFWESRGHLAEGLRWLEGSLRADGQAPPAVRSRVFQGIGWLAGLQGRYDQASTSLGESLRLAREAGDERRTANVLATQGALAQIQGRYTYALALYEESVSRYLEAGDTSGAARPRHNLATIAYAQGDLARAQAMFAENVAEMRKLGNPRILAGSLEGLALTLLAQQEYKQARALLEESLEVARSIGDRRQIASSLHNLGDVVMRQGESQGAPALFDEALALFEEALALAREMEDRFRVTACLESIGGLALGRGDGPRAAEAFAECLATAQEAGYRDFVPGLLEELARLGFDGDGPGRAATLLGAADALRGELGAQRSTEEEEKHRAEVARVRSRLDDMEWMAAWEDGRAMSLDEAIVYALEGTAAPVLRSGSASATS